MVAEWNIRQEDLEQAHYDAALAHWKRTPAKHRGPAPKRPTERRQRPQSPRVATALLAKAPQANVTPAGAAFWFGNGLVHVN